MIFYSIGKRVKNFVKVIINPRAFRKRELGETYAGDGDVKIEKHKYPNGKIKAELRYVNGKLNGISTMYYPNGIIKARENYRDGLLDGLTKRYYEQGQLMSEEFYRHGKLMYKRVFSLDGTLTGERRF
jgi:antitoxin component YwqK of YwqJK toxin-antitoxin module